MDHESDAKVEITLKIPTLFTSMIYVGESRLLHCLCSLS